jgi:glyoxylase-like metal-dependent hydrolase (beta-lactamase superfamily II)
MGVTAGTGAFSGHIDGVGTYGINAMHLGSLTVPAGTPMGGKTLPIRAFVVSHPHGTLLFDSGLGDEHPEFDQALAPVSRRPIEEALAAAGVNAAEVRAVVNCHLHYDHAGGNTNFPGIPIFVQGRELEAVGDLQFVIKERVDFPAADLRVLQGEEEVFPGVRVTPTPGHTPGHQSLVIEDVDGPVVLAGQVAYTVAEFADPECEPARGLKTAYDRQAFLESQARLRALGPRRIYFSHDERFWEPGN